MKILWVSHSGGTHGAERTILEALPGLKARGIEVRLVLPSDRPPASVWGSVGVPVERIDLRWWMRSGSWNAREAVSWLRRAPVAISLLVRLIRSFGPDLVVSNSIVIPQGAIAAQLTGTPHVWAVQEHVRPNGGPIFLFGARPSRWLMRRLSDRVMVPSRALAAQVATMIDRSRIDLVHLAVEQDSPADAPHDGPLLMMGRISDQKGQSLAIRAIAALNDQGVEVPLDLVGEASGDTATRLAALAAKLGVDKLIRFHPPTDRPGDWFGRCSALLVCSLESFGRVTVEAMKAGAPVIGEDIGGTSELIDHGKTGFRFPAGDVAALAKCIAELVADRPRARAMGEAARQWAMSHFTTERFLDELVGSFRTAVRGG